MASTKQLSLQISIGDRGNDLGDSAHLVGQVAGHAVNAIGEVFPDAGHALDLRLAAQLPFGADFTGHASDFRGEAVELIDHGVDRVLELKDLALDIDGDFLGEVAIGDGGGDLGDIAHLVGQVAGHAVDIIGEIFPDAGHAADDGLAAQPSLGTNFAGHASDFRGERVELVDHGVDRVLELENLATNIDGHFLRQVAIGDGGGDLGDIANLGGQVTGHRVDTVGQVFPRAGHALDLGLAAQPAFGADLAGDAGDFRGEQLS